MKIEMSSDTALALMVIGVAVAGAVSIVVTDIEKGNVQVECHKAQQAAIAASSPTIPECK